ncbi:30S ribosomal protein S5 [Candidatus Falkowbacteria bacterium RIFCSPHIGHO2_02_FULL_42_9]|uniref:Small ribosomal subunit protein uS5 n=1 Tax=Candidatus Falkowbacteria bacterium RIFCSPHIGHO2_02_FULL_42_9 TaxID=1797986 RepID=A0A1F5SAC5_9BACT|nr:MAG: 30S ribosomal protein S5 [Candidatus Falkowbacteria bacterium RIFCSPHIGHO2_02_FULL_42_9]
MPEEFEQKMIDIARVTRVMAGGKRMRFRACVAVGNRKGRVAIGLAKGADVTGAVTKAVNKAKKEFIDIPIVNETIPHEVYQKLGAAKILFKPAKKGRGIIAGGVVRIILELSGVKNVTSKILGTGNKVNNAKCVIEALKNLRKPEPKRVKAEKEKPVLSTISDFTAQDKK